MSRVSVLWMAAVVFGLSGVLCVEAVEAKRSCATKRRLCLRKCVRRASRAARRCRRSTLRKRKACLKKSYLAGKKCVRKLKCPQAKACYKSCRDKANPVRCYAKQGCAKMQAACYGNCQAPLGAMLKTCMEETRMKIKWCKEQKDTRQKSCAASCPKCD